MGLMEFVGCVTCGLVCWICRSGLGYWYCGCYGLVFDFADLVWLWFAGSAVARSWWIVVGGVFSWTLC